MMSVVCLYTRRGWHVTPAHLQLFDRLATLADDEADLRARDVHLHHRGALPYGEAVRQALPLRQDVTDQLLRHPADTTNRSTTAPHGFTQTRVIALQ